MTITRVEQYYYSTQEGQDKMSIIKRSVQPWLKRQMGHDVAAKHVHPSFRACMLPALHRLCDKPHAISTCTHNTERKSLLADTEFPHRVSTEPNQPPMRLFQVTWFPFVRMHLHITWAGCKIEISNAGFNLSRITRSDVPKEKENLTLFRDKSHTITGSFLSYFFSPICNCKK